jgi:hypothetical protein
MFLARCLIRLPGDKGKNVIKLEVRGSTPGSKDLAVEINPCLHRRRRERRVVKIFRLVEVIVRTTLWRAALVLAKRARRVASNK